MKVKSALKEKKRLVEEINELWSIVKESNSIEVGNPRHYSIKSLLKEIEEKTESLVELKSKLHTANLPVYSKIFKMSELKNYAKQLRSVSTEEGKIPGRYGSTPEMKEVELTSKVVKSLIKEIQSQIDAIQDELDTFNATTDI